MQKKIFENIKGVLFDLGYTLIEYEKENWSEINLNSKKAAYSSLKDLKLPLPPFEQFNARYEHLKEEFRRSAFDDRKGWKITDVLSTQLAEYKIDNPEKYALMFVEFFHESARDIMYVEDDTFHTLKHLKANGIKTGVLSNTIQPGKFYEKDLERLGLLPFFDFTIFSSEFGWRKPHPKIFKEGIRLIGLKSSEIIYVGDRFNMDALGSKAVGLNAVVKYCGKREYPDPMPENIPMIYNISELLHFLNERNRLKVNTG